MLASSTSDLLRAERQAYSTSLRRRPNPDSVRFCGQIHQDAEFFDQGRVAHNQLDFGGRHCSINHRITAQQTLCVGDDGQVVTRSIRHCNQEAMSESLPEHVGVVDLEVRRAVCIEHCGTEARPAALARSLEVPVEI